MLLRGKSLLGGFKFEVVTHEWDGFENTEAAD